MNDYLVFSCLFLCFNITCIFQLESFRLNSPDMACLLTVIFRSCTILYLCWESMWTSMYYPRCSTYLSRIYPSQVNTFLFNLPLTPNQHHLLFFSVQSLKWLNLFTILCKTECECTKILFLIFQNLICDFYSTNTG